LTGSAATRRQIKRFTTTEYFFFFPFFQSNLFNPDEITKFFPFDIFFLFIKATAKSQFNSRKGKISKKRKIKEKGPIEPGREQLNKEFPK
jgi:hypothetical protein